jgi:peptidoglycan-associated lipoprotein
MIARRIAAALIALCAAVALTACAKKAPTTTAEARPPVQSRPAETQVAPPPSTSAHKDLEGDVLSQDLATINRKGYLVDAYFDYDQAELRTDARDGLAKDAQWLKKYPSVQILLEGHCDDRGTEAYNLALGDKRASAAREYLESLGVPESRIKTVSYGKERPFCENDTDPCWQENRRDHVIVTAK